MCFVKQLRVNKRIKNARKREKFVQLLRAQKAKQRCGLYVRETRRICSLCGNVLGRHGGGRAVAAVAVHWYKLSDRCSNLGLKRGRQFVADLDAVDLMPRRRREPICSKHVLADARLLLLMRSLAGRMVL